MRFKVSLAQINPKTGDIRGNSRKIVGAIRTARERGADLVVLPEMCLTGYCLDEKTSDQFGVPAGQPTMFDGRDPARVPGPFPPLSASSILTTRGWVPTGGSSATTRRRS